MDIRNTSSPDTVQARAQRPAWQTALIALAVLLALSEGAYLLLGTIAKGCIAEISACGQVTGPLSTALFANATNENGTQALIVLFSFGLPGFNNLFYLLLGSISISQMGNFLATVAASVLIGFLVLWGYVAAVTGRGILMKLLLAVGFSIGWFALYNNTEASVFGVGLTDLVLSRYLEMPIAAVSLFAVSFFARRPAGRPVAFTVQK